MAGADWILWFFGRELIKAAKDGAVVENFTIEDFNRAAGDFNGFKTHNRIALGTGALLWDLFGFVQGWGKRL